MKEYLVDFRRVYGETKKAVIMETLKHLFSNGYSWKSGTKEIEPVKNMCIDYLIIFTTYNEYASCPYEVI